MDSGDVIIGLTCSIAANLYSRRRLTTSAPAMEHYTNKNNTPLKVQFCHTKIIISNLACIFCLMLQAQYTFLSRMTGAS